MRFPAILKLWAAHTTPVCATLTAVHPYHSSHPQRSGPVTNNASSSPGRQQQGDMTKRKAVDGENGDATGATQRRSTRLKTTAVGESTEPIVAEKSRRPAQTLKAKAGPIKAPKSPKTEVDGTKSKTSDAPQPKTDGEGKVAGERRYWLMKAEPESRLEKGHDVKFSIDDLAAKTKPEPWDGIRAYAARNNLRAMKKGDLAFFYHSSCKVPAIVGVMEIVQEHSPDMTAQDPDAAYHDPKDSDPANPRWSVVHVEFREKFANPLTLHELKEMQAGSKEIASLQLLKQSRLSVSAVSEGEWEFLRAVIAEREKKGGGEE